MIVMLTLALASGAIAATPPERVQRLPGAQIAQAVERELVQRLAQERSTARAAIFGRVADQQVPAGTVRVELGAIAKPWPRKRAAIPVHLRVDGIRAATLTVWVELQDVQSVLTYVGDYPPGRPASEVLMQRGAVDMTCCLGTPVSDPAEVATLRTQRTVRKGMPAMQADFERVPDVLRLQSVDVEVVNGPVRVTASGAAMADGELGDRIPVRLAASQAIVRGRVVDKQKVVVDE